MNMNLMKACAVWCGRLTKGFSFCCCLFDNDGGEGVGFGEGNVAEGGADTEPVGGEREEDEFRSAVGFLRLSCFNPTCTSSFIVVMHVSGL